MFAPGSVPGVSFSLLLLCCVLLRLRTTFIKLGAPAGGKKVALEALRSPPGTICETSGGNLT